MNKNILNESWCIPPQANAEFVCCIEDVLDIYVHPYDHDYLFFADIQNNQVKVEGLEHCAF